MSACPACGGPLDLELVASSSRQRPGRRAQFCARCNAVVSLDRPPAEPTPTPTPDDDPWNNRKDLR